MYICIDVDGTIVEHDYPRLGNPVPDAIEVMKELQEAGHRLILLTMRSGQFLQEAVDYCKENGIDLYDANNNKSDGWSGSRKVYGHIYIDDAAAGCPLLQPDKSKRPYVDWTEIRKILVTKGALK